MPPVGRENVTGKAAQKVHDSCGEEVIPNKITMMDNERSAIL